MWQFRVLCLFFIERELLLIPKDLVACLWFLVCWLTFCFCVLDRLTGHSSRWWPGIKYAEQAGLPFAALTPASAIPVLGIQVCATVPGHSVILYIERSSRAGDAASSVECLSSMYEAGLDPQHHIRWVWLCTSLIVNLGRQKSSRSPSVVQQVQYQPGLHAILTQQTNKQTTSKGRPGEMTWWLKAQSWGPNSNPSTGVTSHISHACLRSQLQEGWRQESRVWSLHLSREKLET